jgi:dTDP-4-dehydrorhamnose 3,5-epimerase-like enzyme
MNNNQNILNWYKNILNKKKNNPRNIEEKNNNLTNKENIFTINQRKNILLPNKPNKILTLEPDYLHNSVNLSKISNIKYLASGSYADVYSGLINTNLSTKENIISS